MASVLLKRLPRQLKNNIGRYLGIFCLLVVSIALTSGFLMAASSIEKLLGDVRDTYSVEDGRFTANFPVGKDTLADIEALGVKVYENYSSAVELKLDSSKHEAAGKEQTARLYKHREDVDLTAYAQGAAPQNASEVAIDRVYAANHGIEVGDTLALAGKQMKVSGICTLSDYQALFENNSDFVFNAQTFTVAEVTPKAFEQLAGGDISYTYSFVCNDRAMSDEARSDLEEDMTDVLSDANVALSDFLDADANQAIGYAADDVAGDQLMWTVLLLLIIVILGFVFVVLSSSTIEEESAVIGTLLASGYRKGELVRHYLALPMVVGIAGAAVGTALGLTALVDPMKNLYYNSYSLPPYVGVWSWRVFFLCAVVPVLLLFVITTAGLVLKMRATPLSFLRHETSKRSKRSGGKLPERLGFATRFRLRVFLRNIGSFATLFVGISFASLLLVFGLCMMPCVQNYAQDLKAGVVAQHLYTLKAPLELEGSASDRAAYAAAEKLSRTVDMSQVDTDKMKDKLADLISDRAQEEIEDTLSRNFDTDALKSAIVKKGGKGKIAGIDIAQLASASADDPFADIDTDDVDLVDLVDEGILTSPYVDLSDCGLGVVDITSFDADDIDEDSFKLSKVDFSGVSKKDVGLTGIDLGGLSLKQFFVLADKAANVDDSDDAHPVNTKANGKSAVVQAEKYTVTSLDIARLSKEGFESLSVYGIQENSSYWDVDVAGDKVAVGAGLADKYGVKAGDEIVLHDKYAGSDYRFTVSSTCGSLGNTNVYMSRSMLNKTLGKAADYFNGYASDKELKLDSLYVASDLTPASMDKITEQMADSMGDMTSMITGVSVVFFIILMYLLTKTVIDHSARAISYMKVFGYRDREINRLYIRSITAAVAISLVACLPLIMWVLSLVVKVAFARFTGNFVIAIDWTYFAVDIALGLVCYAVVAAVHVRHIKRVPLSLALKVQE